MDRLQLTALPRQLADALAGGRLAVVAGAGISMLAPSGLPSWWAFNAALLAAIKRAALSLLPAGHGGLLDGLSLEKGIPVVAFSDHVVRTFAGPAYFPLLRVLESSRPNANHRALAELARRQRLRHIVTPNFDTLIERAFREAGVPLEVLVGSDSHGALGGRGNAWTRLHKIHGSASDEGSLVDTVAQKLRGLGHEQRAALQRVFDECHVLFIGFSGADFEFDPDYLPLRRAIEAGQSFTWLSRRGTPAPEVARRLARSADWLVEGELPQWFEALGLDPASLQPEPAVAVQDAAPAPSLEQRIDDWLASPGFGPWPCAALCLRLLNHLRLLDAARAFEQRLDTAFEAGLQDPARLSVGVGAALRQLTTSALARQDFAKARAWCMREWQFLEALHRLTTSLPEVSERAMLEYWRNTAGVLVNLAVSWRHDHGAPGRREGLDQAIAEAKRRAHRAQDPGLLAALYNGMGQDGDMSAAMRLQHLRTAQSFAEQAGDLQALLESLHQQATLSMTLAELDQAAAALDEAGKRLPLHTGPTLRWHHHRLQARLAAHRADAGRSLAALTTMQELAGDDLEWLRQTAGELLTCLSWHDDTDGSVAALWDKLAAAIGQGAAAPDPQPPPAWQSLQADSGRRPAFLPLLPDPTTGPLDEAGLRAGLAWAEFLHDDARCLACLEALCQGEHAHGRAWRLRDLALALRSRARAAGHAVSERVAGNHLGIAHELCGDLQPAAQAWQEALAPAPGVPPGLVASIQANLARVAAQTGQTEQAHALFESARATLRQEAAWPTYFTATVNQARLWGQQEQHERAAALVTEAAALAEAQGLSPKATRLRLLAAEFATGRASSDTRIRKVEAAPSWQPAPSAAGSDTSPEQIATQAMLHWEAGDEDQARRLNLQARGLYQDRQDMAGVSRCWHNLATMQWKAGEHDPAIASMRQALSLRMLTDDLPGQIRTHAGLSAYLVERQRHEEGLQCADRGLVLARRGQGEPGDVALLHESGLQAAMALRRWAQARERLVRFERYLQGVELAAHVHLESRLREVRAMLDRVDRALAPTAEQVGAQALALLDQARATARSGDAAGAIRTLQDALGDAAGRRWSAIDRGTLHGELANLMAPSEPAAAQAHYALASAAYEDAGQQGMAWHARGVAAVHLVNAQMAPVGSLLAFAQGCPEPTPALNVLGAYANTLIRQARQGAVDHGSLDALRERLSALVEAGEADAETLGRAALQCVQLCVLCGDKTRARHALGLARSHLTRSNSRYLDRLHDFEQAVAHLGAKDGEAGADGA